MRSEEPFRLLFVCTGNICRSPAAELYARHVLTARLGPAAEAFEVTSAGVYGLAGWPVEPHAAAALSPYGVTDTRSFRARRLDPAYVEAADLVLTATRDHRASVATLVPRCADRVFTLRELARLVRGLDPHGDLPPVDPATRARALIAAAAERRGLVPGRPGDDDVADPYGEGPAAYEQSTRDIVSALDVVLDLIVPEEAA